MKSVVFDLDGTLIDSAPDIHAAAARLLEEEGLTPLSHRTILSFIGNGVPKLVERMIAATGLDPADHGALTGRFLAHYNAAPTALSQVYPGVFDLLEQLKSQGVRMGVCTNKPGAPAEVILREMGLAGYFDLILGGDVLPKRKPDPLPLRWVFEGLGAEHQLYVGDSEVDAETAQRAGIPFALFTGGYRKTPVAEIPHDFAFERFAELCAVVDDLPVRTV